MKRTRAANACPLLCTAKITNHKQKIIHFDTKAQNVRKCATIGIFLLFFIGLAMFCKIPVGYSTPALFMPIIIFGDIYGGSSEWKPPIEKWQMRNKSCSPQNP